jgi:hypothetical protein
VSYFTERAKQLGVNLPDVNVSSAGKAQSGESYFSQRARELGVDLTPKTQTEDPVSSDYFTQRSMELGIIPDTTSKPPTIDRADLLRNDRVDLINQGYDPNPVFVEQPKPGKEWQQDPSRQLPVIGPILRGLDVVANNPIVEKVGEIGRAFYVPGGGLGNIAGLTGAAESAVARTVPKLANTLGGRVAQKGISEGLVAAPLAAGQTQMTNPAASTGEFLKQTALGTVLGGALGMGGKYAGTKIGQAFDNWKVSRNPQVAQQVTDLLALPPGRGEQRLNTAMGRSNLSTNESPIAGNGRIADPLALPEPNLLPPTRARVETRPNIYTQKLENLFETANQQKFTPGRELEELDSLWSRMAGPNDPSLNELIDLAYPKQAPRINAGTLTRAREFQQSREVAGVPSLVRSSSDRYQPIAGDAGMPRERVGLREAAQRVEVSPPKRNFAPSASVKSTSLRANSMRLSENQITATTQGVRGNYQNQLNNGNFSDKLQQGIRNTDQTYDRVTNDESIAAANVAVKDLSAAESKFLLNQSGGPEHIATGYRLMQELDALGNHDRALVVANKLAKDLTKSGQTSQAAAILSRLSPEGQLLNLVRTAEKNGKTVSGADSVNFKNLAAKVQEKSGAGIRANQFNEILNRLERGENVSVDDIQKLSKFLSGSEKVIKPSTKVIPVKDNLPAELKEPRKRDKIVSFLDDAEQAALARISARKNNLNSLPVNEWADHAIVVASQIAKGTIKAATHVEDMVKMFGEEIRPVATQVFQNAQKLISGVSTRAAEGNLQKANEAFTRISGVKKDTTLQEKIVEKYLKENPKVSPKDIDTLRELAKNVTRLSGDQRIDADIAMQKILNSYEKSSLWDKTLAIRYMSMLLNTSTQAINAASGPIMATTGYVADILPAMVDSIMHTAFKTPRATTLYGSNPIQFMARYFKKLKIGAKAGAQGVNPAGIQGTNEIRGLAFKSLYNPLGLAERALGAVAKGPDYATYKSVFDSEMIKQGFLDAKNTGIKGKSNIENHIQKFINDPPEKAILQADRIGKNTTFQRSDTTGGKLANYLTNAPKLAQAPIRAVFPFVRTPVNIASTAVTLTPAGIIKGLYQLTSKSDASRREAIRTLSLGLTGSAGLGSVGYYLHQAGIITGANDSGDKDADNIREQAGKGKYRFNTSALMRYLDAMFKGEGSDAAEKAAKYQQGDKQFDYNKLQPLAFPVAIGASLSENKDKPVLDRAAKAGEDAYGSLYGMSTLKGVQDVFQPSYGGSLGEKALGAPSRLAESFFKSFSPGGLAQEARRQDPSIRKVPFNDGIIPDVTAYFKSRTPGLSQSLPPSKTTLGQTKMNAPGIAGQYLNPYKSEVAPYNDAASIISKLIDSTGDLSLAPSAPDKKVTGKDKITKKQVTVTIPTERYYKLQEDVGSRIIKDILALDSKLTDDKKIEKIKQIYSDVKEKERIKIKKEFGIQVN